MKIYILLLLLVFLHKCNCAEFSWKDNNFDWRLIKEVHSKSSENGIMSPFGVKLLVSLLKQATAGKTEREIQKNLMSHRVSLQGPAYFYDVLHTLQPQNKTQDLNIISNIFIDSNSVTLARKSFQKACVHYYHANIIGISFKNSSEAASKVNQYYSVETNGKIKSIVSEDDFEDAKVILANAIHFEGEWKYPFDKQRKGEFNTGENKIETILMTQSNLFNLTEQQSFSMMELPYNNNNLSMHIILPRGDYKLNKILKIFNAKKFEQLKKAYEEAEVLVTIPKFKIENDIKLGYTLFQMGIQSVFSNEAEIVEFIPADLKVSKILHKAEITVNEKGTKAQAATKITVVRKAPELEFEATKPFLFLIESKETGAILFSGQVTNPKY